MWPPGSECEVAWLPWMRFRCRLRGDWQKGDHVDPKTPTNHWACIADVFRPFLCCEHAPWGCLPRMLLARIDSTTFERLGAQRVAERDRIGRVLEQLDNWIGPQGVNGACAAVWRGGGLVATHAAGEAYP